MAWDIFFSSLFLNYLMMKCFTTGDHGYVEDLRFPCCLRSDYLPDVQLY